MYIRFLVSGDFDIISASVFQVSLIFMDSYSLPPDFRLSPEEAQLRWGIKHDAYYSRLKCLNIKHKRDNSGCYLSVEDIVRLDALHQHLLRGGSLTNYTENNNSLVKSTNSSQPVTQISQVIAESVDFVNDSVAERISQSAQSIAASYLVDARNRLVADYLTDPTKLDGAYQEQIFFQMSPSEIDREWASSHIKAAIVALKNLSP